MKRFLVFTLAGILLLSGLWYADTHLVPSPTPASAPAARPTRTPESAPATAAQGGPQVVIISLDGAQPDRVQSHLADGTMPALAGLRDQGSMAEYALSVDPPLTAAGHAALATGAYPAETGVAGDRYHRPGDELDRAVAALAVPQPSAEAVWRTAMREARRTAAICWPGTSLGAPETLADYTVAYGTTDAPSARHVVELAGAPTWAGAPQSFSPTCEGIVTVAKGDITLATLYLLAIDTVDDDQVHYDTCILSHERSAGAGSALLREGETAPLVIDEHLVSGAYFTLTESGSGQVTLFQSRVCYNRAQPNELVREVNKRFGFFPAGPDDDALAQGWITPEQYVQAAETQSKWISAVTRFVLETFKPEVLFTWQGAVEALQRSFLLVDAAQPGHTPELAAEYSRYVRQAYALADGAVADLAGALDLERATLFVVSDHGVMPAHSQVYINAILARQGLLAYQEGTGSPRARPSKSKAIAVGSGGAAQVYLNLRGRERAGIVPEADYGVVEDAIVAALEKVTDEAGQPVLSRVVRRDALPELGLSTAAAGDLFLQAAPGFCFNDRLASAAVLALATQYGQSGYQAGLPEMHALFLGVGRGIRAGAQVGPVHIVDLAPTVDRLLGLKPPEPRAGRVLEEVLLP